MTDFTASHLNARFNDYSAEDIVRVAIEDIFPDRIACVSSFGTESAVMLHLLARIDRSTPVLFLDTLKHFDETLAYRDQLIARLRLEDVRTIQPNASDVAAVDPTGLLWAQDTDACCNLRKTVPLETAQLRFNALFTGRKRHHGHTRASLRYFEEEGGRIKVNPLSGWSQRQVSDYLDQHGLPRHPLESQGYPSVGCAVCTSRVQAGEDFRAGRWRGTDKVECGIHKVMRTD